MASHLAINDTLGAAYIGLCVASTLHGVSIIQALYYFTHQDDTWRIKLLVASVMVFDTVHQALIMHTVYTYAVTNWGNVDELGKIVWSMRVEVIFNGLTALLVQSFLTIRIWRLSNKNKLLTGIVAALVLGEFGIVIAFTASSNRLKTYVQLVEVKYLSILVNALAAAGDVMITVILCTLLHLSRSGFQKSDTMINKLILFSLNTGFLTSLCAIASLISIIVASNTFLYIAFFFCLGRLYTNSLLATLNARKMIRSAGSGCHSASDNNISLSFPKNGATASTRPTNISIKIDTTKDVATDSDHDQDLNKDIDPYEESSTAGPRWTRKRGPLQVPVSSP